MSLELKILWARITIQALTPASEQFKKGEKVASSAKA